VTIKNKSLSIDTNEQEQVHEVIAKIGDRGGIPNAKITLSYEQTILELDKQLKEYNIQKQDNLRIRFGLRGGMNRDKAYVSASGSQDNITTSQESSPGVAATAPAVMVGASQPTPDNDSSQATIGYSAPNYLYGRPTPILTPPDVPDVVMGAPGLTTTSNSQNSAATPMHDSFLGPAVSPVGSAANNASAPTQPTPGDTQGMATSNIFEQEWQEVGAFLLLDSAIGKIKEGKCFRPLSELVSYPYFLETLQAVGLDPEAKARDHWEAAGLSKHNPPAQDQIEARRRAFQTAWSACDRSKWSPADLVLGKAACHDMEAAFDACQEE